MARIPRPSSTPPPIPPNWRISRTPAPSGTAPITRHSISWLLAPGDAGLVGTGCHSRAGGGLHTAIVFYHQAVRLAPSRAELRTDLGHVYHNHGRYAEALAQYRAALEIDPQFAAAHYDSGLAWLALRRQDLAREAFQAALGLDPGCAACQDALPALQE